MASVYTPPDGRKSYTGKALWAFDASSVGTVYQFGDETVSIQYIENNGYNPTIDASAIPHVMSPGGRMGLISVSGPVYGDRGEASFISTAFGRNGTDQILDTLMNFLPHTGGTVIKAGNIWWGRYTLRGTVNPNGRVAMLRRSLQGIVYDPDGVSSIPTLTAPGTVGLAGLGPSTMTRVTLTDGQNSGTVYSPPQSFTFVLDNGLDTQNSMADVTNRLFVGAQPGQIVGAIGFTQYRTAATPLPRVAGTYPLELTIPTGDGTHAITLQVSARFDGDTASFAATQCSMEAQAYTLFSTGTFHTVAATYPFVMTYA